MGFAAFGTDHARTLFIESIFFLVLAAVAVAGRFIGRRMRRVPLSWDDWLCAGALFFFAVFIAITISAIAVGGIGHHEYELDLSNIYWSGVLALVGQILYPIAMGLVRWSFCALFLRIWPQPGFRIAVWTIIAANGAWILYGIFIVAFRCNPPSKTIYPTLPGSCISPEIVTSTLAGTGLLIEVVIWSLPIPMVWRLHASVTHKLALTGVFGLGLLDIAVGIARVVTTVEESPVDVLYNYAIPFYWINAEVSIAILVACLPACRPILESLESKRLSKLLKSYYSRSNTTRKDSGLADINGTSSIHLVNRRNPASIDQKAESAPEFSPVKGVSHSTATAELCDKDEELGLSSNGSSPCGMMEDAVHVRRDVYVYK